jgi:nucleotidyltransferase/DNA polymerase involved in DNA repair
MQWNSALAVTYPARKRFAIKRGDGWDDIKQKSSSSSSSMQQQQTKEQSSSSNNEDDKTNNETYNECLAIHVPILTTNDDETDDSNNNVDDTAADIDDTIQDEYNRIFGLTAQEKERCRLQELGVRKFAHQGKASIERYRIASARIFTTVLEYCQELDSSIVLERASIDEFFIDVTAAVFAFAAKSSSSDGPSLGTSDSVVVRLETVVVGQEQSEVNPEHGEDGGGGRGGGGEEDKEHVQAMWRGCAIAHGIRTAVRKQLGFTLSAGIGPNKSIAKLSASYGKPNGQAVTLPQHVAYLLNQTPISSCRNLGGKRGKQIQALLPSNVPTTVGSIARYLSLPDLQRKLSAAHTASSSSSGSSSNTSTNTQQQTHGLAVWVYNLARGIDNEPVVSKNESAVLTKSITAFKALPHNNSSGNARSQGRQQHHSLAEAQPWLLLLAKELVNRVERDAARHARYPRQCTIHYIVAATTTSTAGSRSRNITSNSNSRTIRMSFPLARLSTQQKIQELSTKPMQLIVSKEQNQDNHLRITHIGLCAVNFLVRDVSARSINSYFEPSANTTTTSCAAAAVTNNDKNDDEALVVLQQPDPSSSPSPACIESSHTVPATLAVAQTSTTLSSNAARAYTPCSRAKTLESDLELAKKMQKEFDREQRVLEAMDAGMNKKRKNDNHKKKARRGSTSTSQPDHKTRRIDSFFTKR